MPHHETLPPLVNAGTAPQGRITFVSMGISLKSGTPQLLFFKHQSDFNAVTS